MHHSQEKLDGRAKEWASNVLTAHQHIIVRHSVTGRQWKSSRRSPFDRKRSAAALH